MTEQKRFLMTLGVATVVTVVAVSVGVLVSNSRMAATFIILGVAVMIVVAYGVGAYVANDHDRSRYTDE